MLLVHFPRVSVPFCRFIYPIPLFVKLLKLLLVFLPKETPTTLNHRTALNINMYFLLIAGRVFKRCHLFKSLLDLARFRSLFSLEQPVQEQPFQRMRSQPLPTLLTMNDRKVNDCRNTVRDAVFFKPKLASNERTKVKEYKLTQTRNFENQLQKPKTYYS